MIPVDILPLHYYNFAMAQKEVRTVSPPAGRPAKGEQARNRSLQLRLSEKEMQMLERCAEELQESRTDVIAKGIELVWHGLESKKE